MSKKFGLVLFIFTLSIVLAACNDDEQDMHDMDEMDELAVLEVELQVDPTVEVDENLDLIAVVTYGDEIVNDADEVEFEVWEEGAKDDSYHLEATNHEDGTYTAETSFDSDGIFHVQVHVTARGLHTMPKQEVTVGEGAEYPEEEENTDASDHAHEDDDHHHVEGFHIEWNELTNVQTDEENTLTVLLELDHELLTDADVRYEIWHEDVSDEREWITAEETNPGEYSASHSFSKQGTYQVQVHVENDEGLHEHETFEIRVE